MKSFHNWLKLREDGDLNAIGSADMRDADSEKPTHHPPANKPSPSDALFGNDKTDIGAGVLFTTDKEVLLLHRSASTKNPGTWGLPAGHAKAGEGSFHTAQRECEEEIGMKPFGTRVGKSEERDGRWVIYLYRVDRPFDCRLNDEHTEYKWVPWEELDAMNLHPLFRKQLPRYKQMLGIKDDTVDSQ